jgi:hypothetical protein
MRALEFGPTAFAKGAGVASIALAASLMAAPTGAEEARPAGGPPAAASPDSAAHNSAGGEHARHGAGSGDHAQHAAMRLPNGVVSLDVVAEGGKLHLLTGRHDDKGTRILHQVSTDDGKSWSKEVEVQGPPGAGATVTRGSDARIASVGGKLVAMWMSHVEGAPHGGAGQIGRAHV